MSEFDLPGAAGGKGSICKPLRILRRRGKPFLMLPLGDRAAAEALNLYPAQRLAARGARFALRQLCKCSIPVPLERTSYCVEPDSPWANFIRRTLPEFFSAKGEIAVLMGNPNTLGARFLFLLFFEGTPRAVIKAGSGTEASALIRREASLMDELSGAEIPKALSRFSSESCEAFSMEYLPGRSPQRASPQMLSEILTKWIHTELEVALEELPEWGNLAVLPLWQRHRAALSCRRVHPATAHGDFAPWNIKVHPKTGRWQVFDWERGRRNGIPGWDWFHFQVQSDVLVHRKAPAEVVSRLNLLHRTPEFQDYARRSGISGAERELAIAYLLHALTVLKPAEGAEALERILHLACAQWNPTA